MFRRFCFGLIPFLSIPAFGAVLHVGDNCVSLTQNWLTTPSLAIGYPSGEIYYAKLSESACGPIKIRYNDRTYSVCSDGYTRVDYLASTGAGEFIDTEIFINQENINKVKIEVEFSGTYNANWNIPIGIGYPSLYPYCFVSIGYKQIVFGYNGDIYTGIQLSAEQAGSFHKYSIDYSVGEIRLDDVLVHNFDLQQFSGNNSQSLYMFTWNTGGTVLNYQYQPLKIKWARISIDGKMVRDYIPVLDMSGRPSMYDRVTCRYFYNIGSGGFEYGV